MHFKMAKEYKKYFENIMGSGGYTSDSRDSKDKFLMFDVYYMCALIGMSKLEIDQNESSLSDIIDSYPTQYKDSRADIAGLLISSEIKRQNVSVTSTILEKTMLKYLSHENDTMLSEEGIKRLNAYSLRGAQILEDNRANPPYSKEDFLLNFKLTLDIILT